ncbi:MAG: sigma 54-interacting transcriptional regulator [Desulfovibrio sp.]|jgi:transcriptional regulator with PAS, ATPase and Fis domain|nr:sigma 54-interacting transcriptional regulator [Desulfovibrio sp.]
MIHIAFVSPYPELTRLGKSLIRKSLENGIRLDVFEAVGEKAASSLRIKADVAICRGVTGVALRKVLSPEIPLLELKVTGYDVIQALHECRSNPDNPRPYTVIGTRQMVYGLQRITDILNTEMEVHVIGSEAEAVACFEGRMRHGPRTIIGGSTIVAAAERRGVPAVLIRSGEDSLQQAVDEAGRMASVILQERTAVERARISLNSMSEGVLMLDTDGRVADCNTAAVRLLRGDRGERKDLVGKTASSLLSRYDTAKILSGKDDFCLIPIEDGHTIALSVFPVLVNKRSRGAVATLQTVSRVQEMESNIRHSLLKKGHVARYSFEQCLGKHPAFVRMLDKAKMYSATQTSVLLYGETGTGKEIVAQSIHNAGRRRNKPFVAINCAAFPENLLESMLFGYVEGAFTGASKEGKCGFFELAHGGTLLLDEVSEIPLNLQGRLLRVLQEQEVMRLGHDRVIPVDVRVIATTNRPLVPLTEQGMFRGDLFYRLNILGLFLPPLRKRESDVEILARHFLFKFCTKNGRRPIELNEAARRRLREYVWPGNIRELRNFCERIEVTSRSHIVGEEEVCEALAVGDMDALCGNMGTRSDGKDVFAAKDTRRDTGSGGSLRELTGQAAKEAVLAAGGNRGVAARRLGISRTTLWRILKEPRSRVNQ